MECRDEAPSGDSPVVLGSCKSGFEGEGGRYEVDVLGGGARQVGQVSASVDGCEEGSRERAEALNLLGTLAALAYEEDGQGEMARRWVESNFSGGGATEWGGVKLNLAASCDDPDLDTASIDVRAAGYVPGLEGSR